MIVLCAAWWQGTIEYAADKLEEFRQQLELKVVSRFDVAAGKADFPAMAQCASIMSHFPRGSETLINVSPLAQSRSHAEHGQGGQQVPILFVGMLPRSPWHMTSNAPVTTSWYIWAAK